jgi:hypothetical protein
LSDGVDAVESVSVKIYVPFVKASMTPLFSRYFLNSCFFDSGVCTVNSKWQSNDNEFQPIYATKSANSASFKNIFLYLVICHLFFFLIQVNGILRLWNASNTFHDNGMTSNDHDCVDFPRCSVGIVLKFFISRKVFEPVSTPSTHAHFCSPHEQPDLLDD